MSNSSNAVAKFPGKSGEALFTTRQSSTNSFCEAGEREPSPGERERESARSQTHFIERPTAVDVEHVKANCKKNSRTSSASLQHGTRTEDGG